MNLKFFLTLILVGLARGQVSETSTCSCSLVSVLKDTKDQSVLLVDLTLPQISSSLSVIKALHDCEVACRYAQADYLHLQDLNNTLLRPVISQSRPSADKVCSLLRQKSSKSDNSSLIADIYIHFSHNANKAFRKSLPLGRVCCDRSLCGCNIRKQSSTSDLIFRELKVERELGSFECGSEKINCDSECDEKVNDLMGLHSDSGLQVKGWGDRICELEDSKIAKPGLDYYVSLSMASKQYRSSYLGQVCCGPPTCKCELVYNDSTGSTKTNTTQVSNKITSLDAWLSRGKKRYFYECDEDRRICAQECRLATNEFFKSVTTKKDISVDDSDFLGEFSVGAEVCRLLGKTVELPGYDIYLRSSSEQEDLVQDFHIGRLCCQAFFDGFLPFNRCLGLTMPVS